MNAAIYAREPLRFHGPIPVFSQTDEYTQNYERISADHLAAMQETGNNPFIPEGVWVELEESTRQLVTKYSGPGDAILDVGVGLGRLLAPLHSLQRHGLDISLGYLEVAHAKGIEVCYARLEDMPYRSGIFDVVVCTDVLEHVLDLHLACTKILTVLKDDGILVIRVPYRENLSPYLADSYPYRYVHLRSFDEHGLRLYFDRVFGCQTLEVGFAGYAPSPQRMRYVVPIPRWNGIAHRLGAALRAIDKSVERRFMEKIYYPIEINIVLRKTATEKRRERAVGADRWATRP